MRDRICGFCYSHKRINLELIRIKRGFRDLIKIFCAR